MDLKKDYPIIEIVRKVERDGAKYFGPYLEAYSDVYKRQDITQRVNQFFLINPHGLFFLLHIVSAVPRPVGPHPFPFAMAD